MKKLLFIVLFAITFSSCEKDDICSDETTPRLVIEFYQIGDQTVKQNVPNLKVIADGETIPVVLNESATGDSRFLSNSSSIKIPLNLEDTTTKYKFIINSTSTNPLLINEDFLTFNYTLENVYVSRACGYKTIMELNTTDGIIKTDTPLADGFWMQAINIENNSITTENEIHVKIYL
ncbi:DUF6452 family protein [Flavobacterium dankookense]|uniref:Uncharacterized protein n=1 Tax=Flavobacterium dankookense TaxID=706186 RepID=A0A4R6QCC7_9FLAO|nr:DUF6452 family protein [Flavobacterium dankookense]TDP59513.1 hypothetical protein BC748_1766 [Flavobacterium dankookense]